MKKSRSSPSFWGEVFESSTLRNGVIDGVLLNVVMVASLAAANRMPWLDRLAVERNAVSEGLFFLVAILPIVRFYRSPRSIFASGMMAWALFSLGYLAAGMYFTQLFAALRTPFEVLIDGAVGYAVAAVLLWVAAMFRLLRHHTPAATRRRHTDSHL
jgi:hypothetical protein